MSHNVFIHKRHRILAAGVSSFSVRGKQVLCAAGQIENMVFLLAATATAGSSSL